VSFLKASAYQDGHAGYSDPLDEQKFVVDTINFLQGTSEWDHTAVVIMYDDSDGWYDHQMGPIVNQSKTGAVALPGIDGGNLHAQGRCGYGPRQPLLIISPWAKPNFVDHGVSDQTSVLRFIEDNWLGGERVGQGSFDSLANPINQMFDFRQDIEGDLFILNDETGEVAFSSSAH
jgi:phospholipase C